MSLLTAELYSALDHLVELPGSRATEADATQAGAAPRSDPRVGSYTLTHDSAGWMLLIRRHTASSPGWATPLAPHGAGPHATARVAQAVGVRVLHELGVEVTGWSPVRDGSDEPARHAHVTLAGPRDTPRGIRGH